MVGSFNDELYMTPAPNMNELRQ